MEHGDSLEFTPFAPEAPLRKQNDSLKSGERHEDL